MTYKPTCITVGIHIKDTPVFFFDIDNEYDLDYIRNWCYTHLGFRDYGKWVHEFDIYKTKHGYHITALTTSFDQTQLLLEDTKKAFSKCTYIRNCRELRLRIGAKYDNITGKEVSPKPELLECHCIGKHYEKRKGRLEVYATSD